MFAISFPAIDPVLIELGPLAIRWYSLSFIGGLIFGWWFLKHYGALAPSGWGKAEADDLLTWMTVGVVLGGRLGYVSFYNLGFYTENPLSILAVWEGGMSFHGGLIGAGLAAWFFARRRAIPFLHLSDACCVAAPIGLLLGRLANFINGELYGRVGDVPWAMVFPRGGPLARHPSQLYEAALEGVVLFAILYLLSRREAIRRRFGLLSGIYLIGYGLARALVELFREPDAHIGFLGAGLTMGQVLSLPLLAVGLYLVFRARVPN